MFSECEGDVSKYSRFRHDLVHLEVKIFNKWSPEFYYEPAMNDFQPLVSKYSRDYPRGVY